MYSPSCCVFTRAVTGGGGSCIPKLLQNAFAWLHVVKERNEKQVIVTNIISQPEHFAMSCQQQLIRLDQLSDTQNLLRSPMTSGHLD